MFGEVRLLLLLAAILLTTGPAPAQLLASGGLELCEQDNCRPVELGDLRMDQPGVTLRQSIRIDQAASPGDGPLMVQITAMASSEVRWNGVLIGRNGVPGTDRASEQPGRFVAAFPVPPALIRPGDNIVEARLSSHHLWLPVVRPIHVFSVGPYEAPELPRLIYYLPALLTLGALIGAGIYFVAAASSNGGLKGATLLAAIAATATLQLLVEVSRAFVSYSYPWHLARVLAVAVLAGITAVLIAAYCATRFQPGRRRAVILSTALASVLAIVLMPAFDFKALSAIAAGLIAMAVCAFTAARSGRRDGRIGLAAAAVGLAAFAYHPTEFLDRAYYLLLAAWLALLVAEQVGVLRRTRSERDRARQEALALAERLAIAERSGEPILSLKDGNRLHRVAEGDILFLRAADDYCEAVLTDGRTMLVTMTLARLLDSLPTRFVRVHKSYAVNRAHVAVIAARPGGGRVLKLGGGSEVPVGRSYTERVAAAFS